jgi:hypothetical protein
MPRLGGDLRSVEAIAEPKTSAVVADTELLLQHATGQRPGLNGCVQRQNPVFRVNVNFLGPRAGEIGKHRDGIAGVTDVDVWRIRES